MRLKLVLLATLVGTLLGAGVSIAIIAATFGRPGLRFGQFPYGARGSAIVLIPLIVALFAAVFVYRHTARRRKLQAVLTGVLILVLSTLVDIGVGLFS